MAAPTNRTFTGPAHGEAPWEFLQSVDVALLLILMLRDAGTITVTGAAQALGVSPSTAHRSLTMLVYRGFATRSESRTYLPGPALSSASLAPGMGNDLIQACSEHMHEIAKETGETCHLTVLSGANVHFLYSVEGTQPVRVGDRRGQVIPADQNSSGLSMLAELSHSELRVLYPNASEAEFSELRRTLHRSRTRGFAINNGLYEHDVSAVSARLFNDLGDTLGALAVAIPSSRFRTTHVRCARVLMEHARRLNAELEHHPSPAPGPQ